MLVPPVVSHILPHRGRLPTSTRGGLMQLPAGARSPRPLRALVEGAMGKRSQAFGVHPRGAIGRCHAHECHVHVCCRNITHTQV